MKNSRGFSLVEMVIAIFIAAVLMGSVIGLFAAMATSIKAGREQTIVASLITNNLELVRNLPYSDVGTVLGNPNGTLPDQTNPIQSTIQNVVYEIYYEVTYIDDEADGTILAATDFAPNDYKQIKMYIENTTTGVVRSYLTTVSPKGLEGLSNAGALIIEVFDANGQPISGASVHIENTLLNPDIILDRTTDAQGRWIEVGLPASVSSYHIVVTKAGYSSDQTYPSTAENPNPIKADSTIVTNQITEISFQIDRFSTLTVRTLNSTCQNLSGVDVNLVGAKLIGTAPNVMKYDEDLTSVSGQVVLNNFEWDVYTPMLIDGQNLMVIGTSPIQQISVLPNVSQTFTMILGTQTANSLLVIVKDSATGLALEGADITLEKASPMTEYNGVTGGSVWVQNDWAGGSGQADFVNIDEYFSDDGNIDVTSVPTGVRLNQISGEYLSTGQLISSTFDTGANSNFTTISWDPTSQSPGTTVRFQLASNNDNATWNYIGPDGTAGTYYEVPGSNVANAHDNNRYIRYKLILDSSDDSLTPVLTSLAINYVSGCFTPGQVNFGGLTSGNDYTLDVSLNGYQSVNLNSLDISGNESLEVLLSP